MDVLRGWIAVLIIGNVEDRESYRSMSHPPKRCEIRLDEDTA